MEPVRIGLVGYGFGGRWFHAPLLAAAAECELFGIVTSSPERRSLVEREHAGVALFGSLEELAAAGAEAVAISTPAATHTELTDQSLGLGLAVVCDKPFAHDAAAARRSVELAERAGLVLAPYQNRRQDSDFRTVRALVDRGALGTVTRFESRFERFDPHPGPPPSGGGTLLDFGSHLVDQALVLLGPVESVYAEWRTRESGLDDDVFVALTHAGGARAHLWGSWSQGASGCRFRVTGTEAAYEVPGPMDGQEDALLAGRTSATEGERWGTEPPERWGVLRRGHEGEPVPTERGRWDSFYPAFAAAVRGQGPVPVDPRDAVATATVLDAARRSATDGGVVRL
jgi:predicted dehydrogenase